MVILDSASITSRGDVDSLSITSMGGVDSSSITSRADVDSSSITSMGGVERIGELDDVRVAVDEDVSFVLLFFF